MNNKIVFNKNTGMYEARLGQRVLGEFKTEKEAIQKYNEHVTKSFAFPILIKTHEPDNKEES